jgi:hypothetical protein
MNGTVEARSTPGSFALFYLKENARQPRWNHSGQTSP